MHEMQSLDQMFLLVFSTGCRFLNLDVSSLTDKWYGESQKLANAVFSLVSNIF